ncbi:SDR family NAD(P)-dependent oxidoreductase [Phytohabitans kaempferiae]|uniref:SDR family NAD(P)-dependent oxidoreductase n=1 Tax=Phytohabitans kaempferiae TaxID=1620943 RepID=A0ABV6LZM6_9ACTN
MIRYDLTGDRAVVTGAAAGIGRAIAARLAAEGCHVALLDVDEEGAAAAAAALDAGPEGSRAIAVRCDVRSTADVRAAVARVDAELGGIDILVNNAGIMGPILPTAEYPEDDFQRVVDINLMGTYRMTHVVLPQMVARGRGRIVNIASISGKEGNPMMPAYAASKAGVVGMTKSVGKELARTGVVVNCITPGGVGNTDILGSVPLSAADGKVPPPPMGRLAEPEEVAAMTAYLCCAEVSYTTGAVFDLSGGRAMY